MTLVKVCFLLGLLAGGLACLVLAKVRQGVLRQAGSQGAEELGPGFDPRLVRTMLWRADFPSRYPDLAKWRVVYAVAIALVWLLTAPLILTALSKVWTHYGGP